MPMLSRTITVPVTGTAGSATGAVSLSLPISRLYSVRLRYTTQPATVDVVVKSAGDTVFTVSNANTDGTFLPRKAAVDPANAATSPVTYAMIPLVGEVRVEVAQGNAGSVEALLLAEV
jgi:hypothetical protein